MAQQPAWWTYNRIDNFGQIDPQGNYYKPDSNIQVPGNYPITALLPGTVTSVQKTSWGQTVVTIKLDSAINNLATHTFYEHMSSATVKVGQHVNGNDLIGYNNPSGQVPLGFGLYSGDTYGSGSEWGTLQNDLRPQGLGLLNPVALLNVAKSGGLAGASTFVGTSAMTIDTNQPCNEIIVKYTDTIKQMGNVPIVGSLLASGPTIQMYTEYILCRFQATMPRFIKGGLGVILIIAGIVLMVKQFAPESVKSAVKLAAIA